METSLSSLRNDSASRRRRRRTSLQSTREGIADEYALDTIRKLSLSAEGLNCYDLRANACAQSKLVVTWNRTEIKHLNALPFNPILSTQLTTFAL
jgi:hypothetical protein